jgi:hypothetical protein
LLFIQLMTTMSQAIGQVNSCKVAQFVSSTAQNRSSQILPIALQGCLGGKHTFSEIHIACFSVANIKVSVSNIGDSINGIIGRMRFG